MDADAEACFWRSWHRWSPNLVYSNILLLIVGFRRCLPSPPSQDHRPQDSRDDDRNRQQVEAPEVMAEVGEGKRDHWVAESRYRPRAGEGDHHGEHPVLRPRRLARLGPVARAPRLRGVSELRPPLWGRKLRHPWGRRAGSPAAGRPGRWLGRDLRGRRRRATGEADQQAAAGSKGARLERARGRRGGEKGEPGGGGGGPAGQGPGAESGRRAARRGGRSPRSPDSGRAAAPP